MHIFLCFSCLFHLLLLAKSNLIRQVHCTETYFTPMTRAMTLRNISRKVYNDIKFLSSKRAFSNSTSAFAPLSLVTLLQQVENGSLSTTDAEKLILNERRSITPNANPLEAFAQLDHGRAKRTGFPEAILPPGRLRNKLQ